MFFWGSYNFQVTQQAEHPARPPVRYPVYLPPTLGLIQSGLCTSASTDGAAQLTQPPDTQSVAQFIHAAEAAQHDDDHHHPHVGDQSEEDTTANALMTLSRHRLAVTAVACGMKHLVAIVSGEARSNGEGAPSRECVVGFGSNHSGQLGSAVATYAMTLTDLRTADVLEGRVVSVACGAKHTLLCTETGCVYVCGDNSFGQLGLPAPLGTRTQTGLNNGAPCCPQFAQLTSLAHISKVFANQNASFALDQRGKLYSWGDAQYGHLCHNTRGEALDPNTLKIVTENVHSPQLVRWFEQQHVRVVDVAVGKSHCVVRTEDAVYTCGDGAYGKLGSGSATPSLEPVKVVFPERKQPEQLVSIAAGDDHTLVLKDNPVIGSVVYFFGKLSNADGQLTPTIITIPGAHNVPITQVVAGKGTMSACLGSDGQLFVWGKHSYPKVYNGTNASAGRGTPSVVEVLRGVPLTGLAVGGSFCVAYAGASGTRAIVSPAAVAPKDEEKPGDAKAVKSEPAKDEEAAADTAQHTLSQWLHPWDVTVPQDARVSVHYPDGDVDEEYEHARAVLLGLYLGERVGAAYTATLPPTPPKTANARYVYTKIGGKGLSVGQKVRLWMTDVYALATVVRVGPPAHAPPLASQPLSSLTPSTSRDVSQAPPSSSQAREPAPHTAASVSPARGESVKREPGTGDATLSAPNGEAEETGASGGTHVRLEWQRDDWDEESLSLFSDDETLDEENDNRWQPIWFEQGPDGNYVTAHTHK